jgi:hypothetical protein
MKRSPDDEGFARDHGDDRRAARGNASEMPPAPPAPPSALPEGDKPCAVATFSPADFEAALGSVLMFDVFIDERRLSRARRRARR